MLIFEELIENFGPVAIRQLTAEASKDDKAIDALKWDTRTIEDRIDILRSWLLSYRVFQGLNDSQRGVVAKAVLTWTDRQPKESKLENVDAIVHAHLELMVACSKADGRDRDFTSLASKALWLRYPHEVPLYDRFAQEAIWMLSKLEPGLPLVPRAPSGAQRYASFSLVWRTLYDKYADSIAAVDNQGYPYRVRIFDRILWLIGEPVYGNSAIG
jgi:hypothetical protein